jgi:hypothetical protein
MPLTAVLVGGALMVQGLPPVVPSTPPAQVEIPCFDLNDILDSLGDDGLTATFGGTTYALQRLIITIAPDGVWAAIIIGPDGCSRVTSAGYGWSQIMLVR